MLIRGVEYSDDLSPEIVAEIEAVYDRREAHGQIVKTEWAGEPGAYRIIHHYADGFSADLGPAHVEGALASFGLEFMERKRAS